MGENLQNTQGNDKINISTNPVVRWIFIISGFVLVGIGILGMFLPLLPTTIFFILAAWCFARSSERFHYWLHHNRFFGKYLTNIRRGDGMPVRAKIITIAFLWTGILVSAVFMTENLYVRILLAAIAVGVTWHLITIRSIKDLSD
jgi:uncharacterized membrane protein YbaN (DUF454 family)